MSSPGIENNSLYQNFVFGYIEVIPPHSEGRRPSSRTRDGDAVDADGACDERRQTRTAKTCGPDVAVLASTHLEATASQGATEAKEPFSGESTL